MRNRHNIRRYAADPVLSALASDVEHLSFGLSAGDQKAFQDLYQANELVNVGIFPDGVTYRVRLSLGGKQRIIGITQNGPNAAMFADIARLFFWPFRLRGIRPPNEFDFNYGLARAKQALEEYDIAARLLERIRDHLIGTAELKVISAASTAEREGEKETVARRRTVRGTLSSFLDSVADREDTLTVLIKEHRDFSEAQREQQAHSFQLLIDRIESLEKQQFTGLLQLTTVIETVLTAIRRLEQPATRPLFVTSPAHPDWTYIPDNPTTPAPATPPPVWCQDKNTAPNS